MLGFDNPSFLTFLAGIPVLGLALWTSPVYRTQKAKAVLVGVRSLSIGLMILALCEPVWDQEEKGSTRALAVALDVSDSLGKDSAEHWAQALTDAGPSWRTALGTGALVRLATFAKDLRVLEGVDLTEARDEPAAEFVEGIARSRKGDRKKSTHLAATLRFAREHFDAQRQVDLLVLSDGLGNRGILEDELLAARLRGVRVHTLALTPDEVDPLSLDAFQAPSQVFRGDQFTVVGRILSAKAGSVRLELRRNDTLVDSKTFAVQAGATTYTHRLEADKVGTQSLELSIQPIDVPDLHPENNAYSSFTQVLQTPRVLLVTRENPENLSMVQALRKANLEFEVSTFAKMPREASKLSKYSAVILDAPGGTDLSNSQQSGVRKYVTELGGGLLFSGGKRSLAKGTKLRETLEDVLPVHLVPKSEDSPFALYLLLDSSSSMQGTPIAQVRFAAKRIISMMGGRYLGVAHFNGDVHVAVPLQLVGADRVKVRQDVDSIRAAGGTAFLPGLQLAKKSLEDLGTPENHILLLSDGQPSDHFLVRRFYRELQKSRIQVSTVGIGSSVNQDLLREIAQSCSGKYYDVQDLTRLVEIFEEEVQRLIGPPFEEKSFQPLVDPRHPLTRELHGKPLPSLHGYLGTTLKLGAEAPMRNPEGDPVLAVWNVGLGKAAVWTADAHGEWSRSFRQWGQGFVPFWEGVIKNIVRSEVSDFELNLQIQDRRVKVVVDAVDPKGSYKNGETLEVRVSGPPGSKIPATALQQVEEGRYEGDFPAEGRGFYKVNLLRKTDGANQVVSRGGIALGFDPEYQVERDGRGLLASLSQQTGGRILQDLDEMVDALTDFEDRKLRQVLELWPGFAFLALLFYAAEIALRRLGTLEVDKKEDLEGGGHAAYTAIAEKFLKMAEEFDSSGDSAKAQQYYLKARSYFLKSNAADKASRMWEKYRRLEN